MPEIAYLSNKNSSFTDVCRSKRVGCQEEKRAAILGDNAINVHVLSHCPLVSIVSVGCGAHGLVVVNSERGLLTPIRGRAAYKCTLWE